MFQKIKNPTYRICLISWCLAGMGLFIAGVFYFCDIHFDDIQKYWKPCILYTMAGIYCPGCGGTRAVKSLLEGHFFQSFLYHPIILYTVGLYGWYMISNTIQWISREKLRIGIHFHKWFGFAALIIIIGNFILRNILLIFFGIPIP